MVDFVRETILYVINTLIHDAVPLTFGILVAAVISVYVNPDKLRALLIRRKQVSILGSVAFGAFTPFCSCGTMAIIVSMLTTVLPWGAIMAFITSSPLMSPDLFVMLSGIISVKFAVVLTLSTIAVGMAAGYISFYLEKYTHFFDNQIRFIREHSCECTSGAAGYKPDLVIPEDVCCSASIEKDKEAKICCALPSSTCACSDSLRIEHIGSIFNKYKINELIKFIFNTGIKKILLYFSVFAAIGYLINKFVPASVIISLFGAGNIFSVPLAALIGVPLYVSDAGALPLLKTLMDSGAGGGAILAFMITGPGTSMGAIAGSLTIMKRKAVFFYVSILFLGAVILGYLYDLILTIGLL